ncbi:hypothetical protein [Glycocaulis sp.]|uniref:capsular polysaccharide export protein, LipB/KpsS family n=1 Tax=Glycocaulis sp. TaxID=1969725 RepID=UPI003D196679
MAIDPYSRHVFTDFLGKPPSQVTVTGSPKLDSDLTGARGVSRDEARARLPDLAKLGQAPIVLLASQPLGLDRSSEIAEIAMAACAGIDGLWLAIKPHPNETGLYLEQYRRIAARLGFRRLIIMPDARIHDAVTASDMVATYFSTVGLESFALRRPVLCINPYASSPPYDLVQTGIAKEVKDAQSAQRAMAECLRNPHALLQSDPELEAIRDGRASDRVSGMILAAARDYGYRTDPSQPSFYVRATSAAAHRVISTVLAARDLARAFSDRKPGESRQQT